MPDPTVFAVTLVFGAVLLAFAILAFLAYAIYTVIRKSRKKKDDSSKESAALCGVAAVKNGRR